MDFLNCFYLYYLMIVIIEFVLLFFLILLGCTLYNDMQLTVYIMHQILKFCIFVKLRNPFCIVCDLFVTHFALLGFYVIVM